MFCFTFDGTSRITTLHRLIGVGGLLSWCLILQGPTGIQEAWIAFHYMIKIMILISVSMYNDY